MSLFEWESSSHLFGSCGLDNCLILYDCRFAQPICCRRLSCPLPNCIKTKDEKLVIATHGKDQNIQIFDLRKLDQTYKEYLVGHIENDVKKYVQARTQQILNGTHNSGRRFTKGNLTIQGSLFKSNIKYPKQKIMSEFERFDNKVSNETEEKTLVNIWESNKRNFFMSPLQMDPQYQQNNMIRNPCHDDPSLFNSKFSHSMNRNLINQFNTLIKTLSEKDLWDNQIYEYQNLQEESVRAIEMINGNHGI